MYKRTLRLYIFGIVLCDLYALCHLIITKISRSQCHYFCFSDGETETQRGEQLSQGHLARRGRSRTQILVLLTLGPQFPFTVLYRNSLTWGLCPGFLGCPRRCGQVRVLPLTWLYRSQLPGHIWPLTDGVLGVTMGFKRPLPQVQASKGLSGMIPPTLLI